MTDNTGGTSHRGRNIPLFLAAYIYVQFIVCPIHTIIALLTGRANAYAVTKSICDFLAVKLLSTPKSKALHPSAMYLCNHRSWGDFFMDQAICGGGAYLSRYMVILGCPGSSLYAYLAHSTFFFNRKKGIDRDALGKELHGKWSARADKGMIVYPEGTRNQKKEPLRLKTGVLKMAYDYNHPVQSVITTNKEYVANEKYLHCERGVTCVTSVSDVIEPKNYKTFEEFVEAIRKQFNDTWDDAYGCDQDKAEPYSPPHGIKAPGYEPVPIPSRAWIVRVICLLLAFYLYSRGSK